MFDICYETDDSNLLNLFHVESFREILKFSFYRLLVRIYPHIAMWWLNAMHSMQWTMI